MAKELPYFKFEPSEWENGLIQMCNRESKGLFVDIISIYWQRLGDLPYRYVLQKLCNGNADALKELTDEKIIKIDGKNIVIHFLDAQLKEFNFKSKQASDAAKARWERVNETSTLDAGAMQTHSECNAIREEKIRVKKKREENIPAFSDFLNYGLEKEKLLCENGLKLKYESWIENGWKDGNQRKIVNWKSKLLNTIQYLPKKTSQIPDAFKNNAY
jgi:uncharacterized protein YihD (DUF1040 family)